MNINEVYGKYASAAPVMVRYCPECGHTGALPEGVHKCCNDSHAAEVPEPFAQVMERAAIRVGQLLDEATARENALHSRNYSLVGLLLNVLDRWWPFVHGAIGASNTAKDLRRKITEGLNRQGVELVRYCPECASVGPVPATARDCCPDGWNAAYVPANFVLVMQRQEKAISTNFIKYTELAEKHERLRESLRSPTGVMLNAFAGTSWQDLNEGKRSAEWAAYCLFLKRLDEAAGQ